MNPCEFVQATINSSDLSLKQWSIELGVSRQTIYNWLGSANIKIRKIYINKIAKIQLEQLKKRLLEKEIDIK